MVKPKLSKPELFNRARLAIKTAIMEIENAVESWNDAPDETGQKYAMSMSSWNQWAALFKAAEAFERAMTKPTRALPIQTAIRTRATLYDQNALKDATSEPTGDKDTDMHVIGEITREGDRAMRKMLRYYNTAEEYRLAAHIAFPRHDFFAESFFIVRRNYWANFLDGMHRMELVSFKRPITPIKSAAAAIGFSRRPPEPD